MEVHTAYLKTQNGINPTVHIAQLMLLSKDPQPFSPEWTSNPETKGAILGPCVTRLPYLCDIRAQSKQKLGLGQHASEVKGPTYNHIEKKRSFPGSKGRQVLPPTPGFSDMRFSGSSKHLPKLDHPSRKKSVCSYLRNLIYLDPGTGEFGSGGQPFFLWSPRAEALVLHCHLTH